MSSQRFTYHAFISYSHADESTAKWLQHALEAYRLPVSIQKEAGGHLPRSLRPVFRDKTDLSAGSLTRHLRRELDDSRFLIVLCSRKSAASEWVAREIKHFYELGREDCIVPVICETDPALAVPAHTYPPSLSHEILGASMAEYDRERIVLKVVAAILGLRFDQLYERHKRLALRRQRFFGSLIVTLAMALMTGGWWAWDYYWREKSFYFQDFTLRWGMPEGVFHISAQEAARRSGSYQMIYRKNRLRLVAYVNGTGKPVYNGESDYLGFTALKCTYAGEKETRLERLDLLDEKALLPNGKINQKARVLSTQRLSGERLEIVDFVSAKEGVESALPSFTNSGFGKQKDYTARTEIVRHLRAYGASGLIDHVMYCKNSYNQTTRDANGVGGIAYTYDGNGLRISENFIEFKKRTLVKIAGKNGVASVHRVRNANGVMTAVRYLDLRSEPIRNPDGFAELRLEYNARGNITRTRYLGVDNKPTLHKDGNAEFRQEYDERGNIIRACYIGADGKPTFLKNGFAELRQEFDERGNVTRTCFLDIDGKPTLHKYGYTDVRQEYDKRGNLTREWYIGVDGKPTLHKDGYAELRQEFDERGNVTRQCYFDVEGNPTSHKDAHSELCTEYDERGNVTRRFYLGVDGKPSLHKDGFAEIRQEFDERGNVTHWWYLGVDSNPALHENSYVELRQEYDEYGNVTRQCYLGIDGKPTLHRNGYAEIRKEYDERGNATRRWYLGVGGKPTLHKDGYAEFRLKYDERGNVTLTSYFGVDGKPTLIKNGYAEVRQEFDERDNAVYWCYRGVDGKPTLHKDGFAEFRQEYDQRGNVTREWYIGVDGKPTLHKNGFPELLKISDNVSKSVGKVISNFCLTCSDSDVDMFNSCRSFTRLVLLVAIELNIAFISYDQKKNPDTFNIGVEKVIV